MGSTSVDDPRAWWGKLFDTDRTTTELLDRLLRGIAAHISANVSPKETTALIPAKLNEYYHQVGGDYDGLFKATPSSSISYIYTSLGCVHSLQPTNLPKDDYRAPSLPALTHRGFVKWETIQILLDPAEHVPYIQAAVRTFDIIDEKTGKLFPKVLPREAFPTDPDPAMTKWHNDRLEASRSNGTTGPSSEEPRFSDHRPRARDGRERSYEHRSARSPRPEARNGAAEVAGAFSAPPRPLQPTRTNSGNIVYVHSASGRHGYERRDSAASDGTRGPARGSGNLPEEYYRSKHITSPPTAPEPPPLNPGHQKHDSVSTDTTMSSSSTEGASEMSLSPIQPRRGSTSTGHKHAHSAPLAEYDFTQQWPRDPRNDLLRTARDRSRDRSPHNRHSSDQDRHPFLPPPPALDRSLPRGTSDPHLLRARRSDSPTRLPRDGERRRRGSASASASALGSASYVRSPSPSPPGSRRGSTTHPYAPSQRDPTRSSARQDRDRARDPSYFQIGVGSGGGGSSSSSATAPATLPLLAPGARESRPPRGNYRGANVRWGRENEVFRISDEEYRERERRGSGAGFDGRDARDGRDRARDRDAEFALGGKVVRGWDPAGRELRGVDGRRYVGDGVLWRG